MADTAIPAFWLSVLSIALLLLREIAVGLYCLWEDWMVQ